MPQCDGTLIEMGILSRRHNYYLMKRSPFRHHKADHLLAYKDKKKSRNVSDPIFSSSLLLIFMKFFSIYKSQNNID